MLDPYDIDGFYDTHRRVERELTETPEDLVDLVAKAPHLRELAQDRSWIVLVTQPRLKPQALAAWLKEPRTAGGRSCATIFIVGDDGSVTESSRVFPDGLRVAGIRQCTSRLRALQLTVDIAPEEANRIGIESGTMRLTLEVDELPRGSYATMLHAAGIRTEQTRAILDREREDEAKQRLDQELRWQRGREEEAKALVELEQDLQRARDALADDPRLGALGPMEQLFHAAIAKHSIEPERSSRIGHAAVLRIDLRPADVGRPPAGHSQVGGDPQLPADFPWPHVEKGPMWLWLQLDLEALPRLPHSLLPTTGRLLVFVGSGEYPDAPEIRVEWLSKGPFLARPQPRPAEDEEDFMWPPDPAALAASLAVDLPSDWLYTFVGAELLGHPGDDEAVLLLADELGRPAEMCLLSHGDEHGAAVEDGREPREPEAWLTLLTTSETGLWDPLCASVLIHREDLRKRDFSRARLYLFNPS